MAVDKLVDSTQLDADLTSVANAIRVKGGTSAPLQFPEGFVSAVGNIQTGITPSGTLPITDNGTYDVTQFASAEVNVQSGGGGTYHNIFVSEFTPASAKSSITFSISDIGFVPDCCMYYANDFVVQESYALWTTRACECANLLKNKGTCQGYTTTGSIDYASIVFSTSETNVTIPYYMGWQEGTTYSLVLVKIKE